MKKVAILVLNYRNPLDTIECIQSLWQLSYPCFHICVIDNHSKDDSVEQIQASISDLMQNFHAGNQGQSKTIELIVAPENKGFAGGNNLGIRRIMKRAEFDFFWILNNDTTVDRGALDHLVNTFEDYKNRGVKIGVLGSKLRYYDRPNIINSVGGLYNPILSKPSHLGEGQIDVGQYDHLAVADQLSYVTGASMFFPKEAIEDVGLLCEDYFLYFEELDWVLRAKKKGWRVGYCWRAIVYHKEGRSIGTHPVAKMRSELSDFWLQRNRLFFTKKHYPYFLPIVYMTFFIVMVNRLRRGQFRRLSWIFRLLIRGGRVDPRIVSKIF